VCPKGWSIGFLPFLLQRKFKIHKVKHQTTILCFYEIYKLYLRKK
jgi:hypothetical protein